MKRGLSRRDFFQAAVGVGVGLVGFGSSVGGAGEDWPVSSGEKYALLVHSNKSETERANLALAGRVLGAHGYADQDVRILSDKEERTIYVSDGLATKSNFVGEMKQLDYLLPGNSSAVSMFYITAPVEKAVDSMVVGEELCFMLDDAPYSLSNFLSRLSMMGGGAGFVFLDSPTVNSGLVTRLIGEDRVHMPHRNYVFLLNSGKTAGDFFQTVESIYHAYTHQKDRRPNMKQVFSVLKGRSREEPLEVVFSNPDFEERFWGLGLDGVSRKK